MPRAAVCRAPALAFNIAEAGKGAATLRLSLVPVSLGLASLLIACGSGGAPTGGDGGPKLPPDAAAIRKVDAGQVDSVQMLLRRLASGEIDSAEIVYADVTGDLREEAIVPISSRGTLGNIAYVVVAMRSGKPEVILTRTLDRSTAGGGLKMEVRDGVLYETAGVYGEEDPLCCPSQLRVTAFHWDGSSLQVEREERLDQPPSAKQ